MKKQKVWLVTGAGTGMGFEIVKAALKAGDNVVAAVRSDPEKTADELKDDKLFVVAMDVTRVDEVKKAVDKAIAKFGRLDVVVNNAGFGFVGAIEEISNEETKRQYDTNVFGVLNVIRAVLPQLRGQRSGHIINITSYFGYDALPTYGLYGSTKYAVEGISQGLALELAAFGIKVTALAPGLFRTKFLQSGSYAKPATMIKDYDNTVVGQMRSLPEQLHGSQAGDPEKLAKVVVELANLDNPPLHLPVGKDALEMFRKGVAKTSQEVEKWAGKLTPTEITN